MNITKNHSKWIATIMAIILVLGVMIPSANNRAYAADGKISIKVGKEIDYSSHRTHYFYAGDKGSPIFCAQPQLPAPASGTYDYSYISPTSMLAKCLYYGLGGPGYEKYVDKQLTGEWDGEDDAYCLTHIIISIAYDKTTSEDVDPFKGLSGAWKTKAQNLYNYVSGLPAPPVNYRAYMIKISGCQDILGSFNDVGNIKIMKSSADKSMSDENSCYSLEGAKYGVYYGNNLIGTITTDKNGVGELQNVLVADYTIKEIGASKGYAIDVETYNCRVENEKTTIIKIKEQPKDDPIGILLRKGDAETGLSKPQGSATLKDAVYEVKYYKHQGDEKKLAATWRFKTDENGIAHFAEKNLDKSFNNSNFYYSAAGDPCIPLGTVTIQEVKAPEGYLLNDKIYTCEIKDDGGKIESVYTYNVPEVGSEEAVSEQVKRGDLKFVKIKDGTMQRLSNIQFKITSKTTGESHIVCTDENGIIDTSSDWNSHKDDTNGGSAESGVWFGEIGAIDDSKGALLYDYYTIDEIRGENNEGLKLLKNVEFRIYRDSTVLDLGTVTDDVVRIKTEALDKNTQDHISLVNNPVTIIDTVSYKNLTEGKLYRMIGTLMDKSTGKPVISDGKKVTSEKEFICKDENGTIKMEFSFDASDLYGKDVVVYEKCFDVKAEEEVASHEDLEDNDQTVSFPKIGTKASAAGTDDNILKPEGMQSIVDTITYKNLIPGREYKAKTWLVESDGKKINGTDVETTFTATEKNGSIDVKITFDAEKVKGDRVTVFEEIYLIKADSEILVGEHKDTNDNDQTVKLLGRSPKTGDSSIIWAFIILALIAGSGTFALMKKPDKEEPEDQK